MSCFYAQNIFRSDRNRVRILIILGSSSRINVAEDNKLLKEYSQDTESVVLAQPSVLELN
ncbi:MAG: hypothetical protein AAF915_19370 [Cyanobacteria bacterium P01_D01_bin.50]